MSVPRSVSGVGTAAARFQPQHQHEQQPPHESEYEYEHEFETEYGTNSYPAHSAFGVNSTYAQSAYGSVPTHDTDLGALLPALPPMYNPVWQEGHSRREMEVETFTGSPQVTDTGSMAASMPAPMPPPTKGW
jgi:hypothetical protein